jgi:hypothetical protein
LEARKVVLARVTEDEAGKPLSLATLFCIEEEVSVCSWSLLPEKERRTLFVAVDFSVVPNWRRYLNS